MTGKTHAYNDTLDPTQFGELMLCSKKLLPSGILQGT